MSNTDAAVLCGHRWVGPNRCPKSGRGGGHTCGRPVDHEHEVGWIDPTSHLCACRTKTSAEVSA